VESSYNITWTPFGNIEFVNVYYSNNSAAGPWKSIAPMSPQAASSWNGRCRMISATGCASTSPTPATSMFLITPTMIRGHRRDHHE